MATLPLDIARIYLESAVEEHVRGRKMLARFPEAERIPELRKGDAGDYLAAKRRVKQGLIFRPNGRSADCITTSSSNGCAMACAYCYVAWDTRTP